jgi:hypothetical protein
MAKIPYLHPHIQRTGTISWKWKPSPRLRKAGWKEAKLGESPPQPGRKRPIPPAHIVASALQQNEKLEAWDLGVSQLVAPPVPKKYLWDDLVAAYRASPEFRDNLRPKTRREYDSRLGQLRTWAMDGALPICSIDKQAVKDLKAGLRQGSMFRAAAMLRVLRLLLRWAVSEGLLDADPTSGVAIPTPPSRRHKLAWRDVEALAAHGEAEHAIAAQIVTIAFWTMLRREDLRQLNRFHWRELHGADPRDIPALANDKGEVWGFRVTPHKTSTSSQRTVDCPMPPWLHEMIDSAFAKSQWLFAHPQHPTLAITPHLVTRRVKALLNEGGFPTHQLRDMRRSGMSGVADMGADRSDVFAISGHPLLGQRTTMADTYMPPDTRAACRAIAAACRTIAAQKAREEEG